jgi:hypothetical protein
MLNADGAAFKLDFFPSLETFFEDHLMVDARIDFLFLKRFCRILGLMFSSGPDSVALTCFVLIVFKVGQEAVSYQSGLLISKFYRVLGDRDYVEFNLLVVRLIFWYIGLCALNSLSHYGNSIV